VLAGSCSFKIHELHLRITVKGCKYFFLTLEGQFIPLQIFSCACKFILRLQSCVLFPKSYPAHVNCTTCLYRDLWPFPSLLRASRPLLSLWCYEPSSRAERGRAHDRWWMPSLSCGCNWSAVVNSDDDARVCTVITKMYLS